MIPKAELHCHLEGSIPPALARELAARNGVTLPDGMFDGKGQYVWQDFLSFLDAYDRVCAALRVPRDFGDVLYTYLKGAAAEGARRLEQLRVHFCSAHLGDDLRGECIALQNHAVGVYDCISARGRGPSGAGAVGIDVAGDLPAEIHDDRGVGLVFRGCNDAISDC